MHEYNDLAQWVIDNRYSKGENQTVPDIEIYGTIKEYQTRVDTLVDAVQEFIDRVDEGQIRSTYTYNKFKNILNNYRGGTKKVVINGKRNIRYNQTGLILTPNVIRKYAELYNGKLYYYIQNDRYNELLYLCTIDEICNSITPYTDKSFYISKIHQGHTVNIEKFNYTYTIGDYDREDLILINSIESLGFAANDDDICVYKIFEIPYNTKYYIDDTATFDCSERIIEQHNEWY